MNAMPLKLRRECAADPFYKVCARNAALHDHVCQADPIRGRAGKKIEWEHALYFAGSQLQKKFAIVPLCWFAHRGPGMKKAIAEWIALNRATDEELAQISTAKDYRFYRERLNEQFGPYHLLSFTSVSDIEINYA